MDFVRFKDLCVQTKRRGSNVNFALKVVALLFNIVASILVLTNHCYYRIPVLTRNQLKIYVYCIPTYLLILPYLLILKLVHGIENIVAMRYFLLVGIALYLLAGIIGVVNYLDKDTQYNEDIRLIILPIICLVIAMLFIIDFLKQEDWFKKPNEDKGTTKHNPTPSSQRKNPTGKKSPKNLTQNKPSPTPKKRSPPPAKRPPPPLEEE